MKDADITAIVRTLKREVERWDPTAVGQVAEDSHDPFRILRYLPDWRAMVLWYKHLRHDRRSQGSHADAL